MSSRKPKLLTGNGCGFVALVGLIAIALLIVNGIFVQAVLQASFAGMEERLFHPIQFTLPIALIFGEFWVFDRIVRYFENRSIRQKNK